MTEPENNLKGTLSEDELKTLRTIARKLEAPFRRPSQMESAWMFDLILRQARTILTFNRINAHMEKEIEALKEEAKDLWFVSPDTLPIDDYLTISSTLGQNLSREDAVETAKSLNETQNTSKYTATCVQREI